MSTWMTLKKMREIYCQQNHPGVWGDEYGDLTSSHKMNLCQASIMSRDNLQQDVIFRSNKAASFGNFIMFLFGYAMDKQ